MGWPGYSHFMLIIIFYTGMPVTVIDPLIYDRLKEQWIPFLFTEHTVKHSVILGVLRLLLPKRSYDLLLWGLRALKATSKDYSQQS